jgi:ribosomal protein L35AE/L33A
VGRHVFCYVTRLRILFAKYNYNDQLKKGEISRVHSTNGVKRNVYEMSVGKAEGKRPLGRFRRR